MIAFPMNFVVCTSHYDVEREVLEILAASNHVERSATSVGRFVVETFGEAAQVQIQLDGANCVLVARIDNPEIVQHCGRATEAEVSESIEQTTANHVYVDLTTKKIEGSSFFRGISPPLVIEFAASLPGRDGGSFLTPDSPIVNRVLVDSVAYFYG